MQAHQLRPPSGARHARKRTGRGNASGHGTYAGRGLKGQKARAGRKPRRFFEGGQTRLFKKLPYRRGFTNIFRTEYQPVNLDDLGRFETGTEVTPELLKERGLLSTLRRPVKILADGGLTKALTVHAHRFSSTAREKIEAAGGAVVWIGGEPQEKAAPQEKPAKKARAKTVAPEEAPAPEGGLEEASQRGQAKGEDSGDGS